jgi:acyl-CoA synthetase (AMP-forming)/AMP-acid ligase II
VRYTHGQFDAQVRMIRDAYGIEPGEIDLPLLPLFALFAPALGLTTIVPELDPSRPGQADPAKLAQAVLQENVTMSFGSPTLWGNLAVHGHRAGLRFPTLRRVLCAGAPVPPWLWESLSALLPNGRLHSPYGATEALPVATISAAEVVTGTALATRAGAGACVGRILLGNTVKIVAPVDGPVPALADAAELPAGEIGEIIVAGPTVTLDYDALPEATAAAKIQAPGGVVFHRLGDLGYLDAEGRLWFVGRKAETVHTARGPLHPAQVEPLFESHPEIRRVALVGSGAPGRQRPCLVAEPVNPKLVQDSVECRRLTRDLRQLALLHEHTTQIKTFYFHPSFPVDVRHNAKIHRLALARWVDDGATGFESDPKR